MAIEKGVYQAPDGLPEDVDAVVEMEVMSDAPVQVELEDGSIEINFGGEENEEAEYAPFDANLAEYLEENELRALGSDLVEAFEGDTASRKEWADTFVKGLEVLGFTYEERTEPWEDACGVYSNVLAEAAIRFQAEAMSETFPAGGPVKTKIIGEITKEKEDAALRVKADMNYELTEVMTEYPERVTHVMRKTKNELLKLQAGGFYREVDLDDPAPYHTDIEEKKAEEGGYSITSDDRYTLLEVHADLVIDGIDNEAGDEDKQIAKPYVVAIERGTGEVLSIRRNWNPEDPLMLKRQYFVHYVYVPGFGFYGLGLIHIIGGYAKAGTSLIRQLVDAGTLSNLPGGLKSRGLRVKGDDTPIGPGEFRDVDVPSGSIKENIMTLPYKEPSQTLLALLQRITEEGRRLGAISDMNISDMSANAPVGTTLALLERTLKPMAAVQSRVHYAMKQEFKLLRAIIAEYAPEEYMYVPDRGEPRAKRDDYAVVDVIPVSDPNSSTMAQRVVQYQAVLQMAQAAPQIYDLPQLHRQMIEVLGIKNADKLVPTKDDIKPADPVSENMNVLVGKPIKAFIYQDHAAHIRTHQAFLQDPQIAAFIGQNPAAQQIVAALNAHVAEHIAFDYRVQLEQRLGAPLPAPNEELSEKDEVLLARLISDAAIQNTQAKQAQAAQAAAQQKAQDPVIQMQQQELQIKAAEQQRKAQKDQADAALDAAKLQLDKQKADKSAAIEAARVAAQVDQANARQDLDEAKAILDLAKAQKMPRRQ
jgi:hypothetical protein